MNPLKETAALGQSIWLDFISRKLLDSGELHRMVEADGLGGVTSNPSIFEKTIREGTEYAAVLADLRRRRPGASAFELYEALAVRDIQDACDVMKPVYDRTKARDGYVSLEVTLHRGDSPEEIVREAVHLWEVVARPNVMIKVPGTANGRKAFEELIAAGINVNVTLLFARAAYAETLEAYLRGLERRAKSGGDLARIASVASFFVSRIDSAIDKQLEAKIAAAKTPKDKSALEVLCGRAAIANAKLAYAHYEDVTSSKRWRELSKKGAQTQRVLWASTGTKNKKYSDVLYVEELIGRDTVNTAPPATIDAFRDHGKPRSSLNEGLLDAKKVLRDLDGAGISLDAVTDALLADGLKQFSDAFDTLLASVRGPSTGGMPAAVAPAASSVPAAVSSAVASKSAPVISIQAPPNVQREFDAALAGWAKGDESRRFSRKDATVWTGSDEARWLGWLDAPARGRAAITELKAFADQVKKDNFQSVLLLGMGGSSLCPEVLARTFGSRAGYPALHVLDSTDPAQVAAFEGKVDLSRTLVVVASKSGSTLEPNILDAYFWDRVVKKVGAKDAGRRFVAITDPGSKLEGVARAKGYRKIFAGDPAIGGRFSALSMFGLVPAALIGVDLDQFLTRADAMAKRCIGENDPTKDPGVLLGAFLGACAKQGRDKLTLVVSPRIASLGGWLEQLVAESTGKRGLGIIPVDLEPLGPANLYGDDRVFAYVRLAREPDKAQDAGVEALERAGHAVVRIDVGDELDLGAEFYRWEIATSAAGAVLGIHPFDQPDVEASKIATRELTNAYEATGTLPPEKPFFEEGGVVLYAPREHALTLYGMTGNDASLADVLRAHFATKARDYVGILGYVPMDGENTADIQAMRVALRDARRVATCVGFGPRFLHSTGQAYKGGPKSGVFLQITRAVSTDLPVPGQKYGFGIVQAAQARGDLQVLVERGQRTLRAHITGELRGGMAVLRRAVLNSVAIPTAARP
ncbi:MAG: bifunctional transaldolase/phosoglucose isomerase [Planctomycetota bacterium]|nr:bifunctional transaldolase/phosoglucose isomerase [Planctomycetota bacterium]